MSRAIFADNLYGLSEELRKQGAGLFGTCPASWIYERHGSECKPGLWRVGMVGGDSGDFWELPANAKAHGVMDDFGSLRRVA